MERSAPKVSVVIPNHNGATPRDGLTFLELIRSSLREQSFRDFDVTVVDDASTDDSIEYLGREWPDARIVRLAVNSGFAVAVNSGIRASAGEHIALLNNDVELSGDWLELLVRELDADPSVGFVTGKILGYERRSLIDEAGQDYYTCGRFSPRGQGEAEAGNYEERASIPIATAAASIYRRESVERAGLFDEDYFLYCEDSDLCLRMLLGGYRGLYVPEPRAYHVGGGTTGHGSELARFHVLRNGLITLVKDMPGRIFWRSLLKILVYEHHQYQAQREGGYGHGTWLRAWGSFLRMLPGTIGKRIRIQRRRKVSANEFQAFLHTEFPLATRWGRLVGWRPPL